MNKNPTAGRIDQTIFGAYGHMCLLAALAWLPAILLTLAAIAFLPVLIFLTPTALWKWLRTKGTTRP